MTANHYRAGAWNAICDRCGFKFKNADLRLEWNGLRTCRECWEPRHPQDLLRGKKDDQTVPWSRPDSDGTDVSVGSGNEVTPEDL